MAAMLLDRYRRVPMVMPFARQMGEAIEAAHLGLYHAAVALLITAIEGIVREHATQARRDLRNAGAERLSDEVAAMIEFERQAYPGCTASDERISMIEAFGDFLTSSLYMNTWNFAGDRELNRHGALHGLYRDYGNAPNFYVLVSIVDLLTFVLTFRTSGVSVMAPEVTLYARRTGLYYIALREVGRVAGVMGARR